MDWKNSNLRIWIFRALFLFMRYDAYLIHPPGGLAVFPQVKKSKSPAGITP
jgi:hypothetical protein